MYLSLFIIMIERCVPGALHISKMMYGSAFIFNKNKNFLKLTHLFTGKYCDKKYLNFFVLSARTHCQRRRKSFVVNSFYTSII